MNARPLRTGLLLPAILALGTSWAQRSPFTGREVLVDSSGTYRLLIGGHFHGESTNRTGYPARTLLANIDTINSLGADVMLSTGDLFMEARLDLPRYQRALFSKLQVPLFNAVGNHDLDGGGYTDLFGSTTTRIDLGRDRILVFDTERDGGSIRGEQLDLLKAAADDARLQRLFIVSHRPVWAEDDTYGELFAGNTRSVLGTNYAKEVAPLLERIAGHAEVFWISGSMAGGAPSSVFFQPHAPRITFIQSAIRDILRDALLVADVSPQGVEWSVLPLTAAPTFRPEDHDAGFWRARKGKREAFNWRLLPYYVKTTLLHRNFWWGVVATLLVSASLRRLLRCIL